MLFTENDLNYVNALDLLEEATYLSEDESIINPATIPVKEISRLGYGVVRFDDVDKLSEDYGIDYIDAMYAIAEASDMNPEYLAVSVPEGDIIAYPEIVNELANIVVQPLSEDSLAYQYVDMCLEAWDNTGDEDYLEAIVEDYCLDECLELLMEAETDAEVHARRQDELDDVFGVKAGPVNVSAAATKAGRIGTKIKNFYTGNFQQAYRDFKGTRNARALGLKDREGNEYGYGNAAKNLGIGAAKVGATAAAGYGIAKFAKWVKEANNRPKSWIGQKIAALRGIYQKWMQQAQKNPKKAGMIKSVAAKLLSIIDALMAKLQTAAG